MANLGIERGPGIFELVDELKKAPERLDKDMRASFRTLSGPIRDRARARVSIPAAKTRRHKGRYNRKMLANAITSSASSVAPTLRFGTDKVPGWAGWEFGSDRLKNFGPRTPKGRFFFPTIEAAKPEINAETQKVVESYMKLHFEGV